MEYIYLKGFLYYNIKLKNFLIGTRTYRNILYTVDFGLAKEFYDAKRYKDFKGRPFSSISRYVSINNHNSYSKYPV